MPHQRTMASMVVESPPNSTRTAYDRPLSRLIYHDTFSAVVYLLDATSIAVLARCNKHLKQLCSNPNVLSWISQPRAVGLKGLSCVEHLRIFELISKARNSFHFNWGKLEVEKDCYPYLRQLADIMETHDKLCMRVEGHCGLEAPDHIALGFSRSRAESICRVLRRMGVEQSRMSYIGYGKTRPKVCLCGPYSVKAQENRRTELYLYDGTGAEFPTREPLPNITEEDIQRAIQDSIRLQNEFQARIDNIMEWVRDRTEETTAPASDTGNADVINPREEVISKIRLLYETCEDACLFYDHMHHIFTKFEAGLLDNAAKFVRLIDHRIYLEEDSNM